MTDFLIAVLLIVILLSPGAVAIVVVRWWLAHKAYKAYMARQGDPSGGVTPAQRAALGRELSADEEILACIRLANGGEKGGRHQSPV